MKNRRKIARLVVILVLAAALVVIGPMDYFSHGFYSDIIDWNFIAKEDLQGEISLEGDGYQAVFTPMRKHFAGFCIYLLNQPEGNSGTLCFHIYDANGRQKDKIEVKLAKVPATTVYRVYTNASLKEGEKYTVQISAKDCTVFPSFQAVDPDYLSEENLEGNAFLGYAYAESTFSLQNKCLIVLMLLAVIGILAAGLLNEGKMQTRIRMAMGFLALSVLFTWNYLYNSMDTQNETFEGFQEDSERLVTNRIIAGQQGTWIYKDVVKGYGLASREDGYDSPTDDLWQNGYSRTDAAIAVKSCEYTDAVAVEGNYIRFKNGECFRINQVVDEGTVRALYLDAGRIMNPYKYGYLYEAYFCDADQQEVACVDGGILLDYKSQYGLQGKVFCRLAGRLGEDAVEILQLCCALLAAMVFLFICYLVAYKYNFILAGTFAVTFLLSPWVVNFARNLYWVEFTWFLPMAVGLLCAWKADSRGWRIGCYVGAYVTILLKCLCGYEYISTIMMGLISFLLVDFILALFKKDKERGKLLFWTIAIIGVAALLGFVTAICIHAVLRGEGNLLHGIASIVKEDVLRRTNGADMNNFDPREWESINASVWETFCMYFHFSTQVITGIPGNLFPVLSILPPVFGIYDYCHKKQIDAEKTIMYAIFFLTTVSWYCLGKSHSYEHPHMNYVLWYFGYVQICFYIIVQRIRVFVLCGRAKRKDC